MARLTKKKTEAAQAAEVATENKETLAAEAATSAAAEAVKATEEAAEPTPYEAALKEAEKQAEEAAKAAEEKKVKPVRAEFAGCKSGLNKFFPNHFALNLIAGRIGVPGVEKLKVAYVV